jgi:RNA polymerase sigma factor (sigma-70 family)
MTGIHRPAFGGRPDVADTTDTDTVPDDHTLLQRLRAGEDAAFGELFSRHCDAVRRLAHGLAADRAEADDLTAEAFFRVLQAIKRGSGPVDNVRGYLLIVARRVAWEWNGRRRDVPVSDDELNYRVGADPDRSGQATERNLITTAFTSLPERWRSVLWEVEVEGARPAVVAVNFGLSPNATAALARRARQGLRAAYLQAHLAVGVGSTGCRSVLEKLGGYTAGTIKGIERRKVRVHLSTCVSCTAMFAELEDVCSGLRAHAAFLAAPVAGVAMWQHMATVPAVAKGLLVNAKIQVALAATSAAAVGVFGFAMIAMGGADSTAVGQFDSKQTTEAVTPAQTPTEPTASVAGPSTLTPHLPNRRTAATAKDVAASAELVVAEPAITETTTEPTTTTTGTTAATSPTQVVARALAPGYDDTQPVVFEQTSYERKWSIYDDHDVVEETKTQTKVNAANQTTVVTQSSEYTVFHTPEPTDEYSTLMLSPSMTTEPARTTDSVKPTTGK